MKAFAVKHIANEQGPLSRVLVSAKKQPYSLTNKKNEAEEAAKGNFVYLIEVLRESGETTYRLGYKFRSSDVHQRAGSALWEDQFKYKNTVSYGSNSDGVFFEEPVEITDPEFNNWLKCQTFGMIEIPKNIIEALEKVFMNNAGHVQKFEM